MAERFNQTLMNKVSKMFTERNNYRYIDDIDNIVNNCNNAYHSNIKMTPIEASKQENEGIVYYNLYTKRRREMLKRNNKPNYKKSDKVRTYRYKKLFEKGYSKEWTDEITLYIKSIVQFHRRTK